MRTVSSVDHNQMLVVSFFLHLLIITIIMFLPKPKQEAPRIIIPTFNFEVVDIPSQPKAAPKGMPKVEEKVKPKAEVLPPVEEKSKTAFMPPREKTKEVKSKPPVLTPSKEVEEEEVESKVLPPSKEAEEEEQTPKIKKIEPPPPVKKPKAESKIIKDLVKLEDKPKDELARLEKLRPQETFKNLDDLKKRKKEEVEPEKPLKSLEELKNRKREESAELETPLKNLDELKKRKKEESAPAKALKNLDELKKRKKEESAPAKPIKSLDALAERKKEELAPEKAPEEQKADLNNKPDKSVLEKLEEYQKSMAGAKKIDVAMNIGQPFSSALHKPVDVSTSKATVSSEKADVLSSYIDVIHNIVYANWKNPLRAENKEVHVSFFLYSQGNIGKPFIEKSSGNEKLDSIAVRAVLDSDPFPKFPPNMKEPSLQITIRFKYIPQD